MREFPKFVPIPDIGRDQPSPKVVIEGIVPLNIDINQLGVNRRRIEALCKTGGIGSLRVIGVYGDSSRFKPSSDSKEQKNKTLTHTVSLRQSEDNIDPHSARWADATIHINMDEIADRISTSSTDGSTETVKAWTKQLNSVLKKGIRQAGFRQLVTNSNFFDIIPPLSYPICALADPKLLPLAAALQIGSDISVYFMDAAKKKKYPDRKMRLTIFSGLELDRAAILALRGRTSRLVKALPPTK